ncbi:MULTISPECIES: CDP-glycerol glycerophosphotransferase family protein [unclassified Clostridium]|uniref:CDP-glycerol glycerophosphotransferase family protein n=1 Tax=unclassified Clostridium TaxID=2614128 RepID=UPI0032180B1D
MKNVGKKIKENAYNLALKFFSCLPIKLNKVFIYSYYGSQYGDNPKYISEFLVNRYPADVFDVVWAFNNPKEREQLSGIRKVRTMSLKYFYEMCTSKVIVTNFRTTEFFKKRKEQYYIQTWHSSLRLKKIEGDVGDSLKKDYIDMAKKDSKKMDLLLSGCKYSTDIFKRAFWYDGEIMEGGTPRNDMLIGENKELKKEIKKNLGIDEKIKVVLYAPTFRNSEGVEVYNLNFEKIIESLKEKFSGDWVFLVKLHPHMINKSKEIIKGKRVRDVTTYDDIQELLLIADVLISDYSSLIFDFEITKRPCFLYVPDLEEYKSKERRLYFDIDDLPFVIANSNEELEENILKFNQDIYIENISNFDRDISSFEDGQSSKRVAKKIYEVCHGKESSDEKEV